MIHVHESGKKVHGLQNVIINIIFNVLILDKSVDYAAASTIAEKVQRESERDLQTTEDLPGTIERCRIHSPN